MSSFFHGFRRSAVVVFVFGRALSLDVLEQVPCLHFRKKGRR